VVVCASVDVFVLANVETVDGVDRDVGVVKDVETILFVDPVKLPNIVLEIDIDILAFCVGVINVAVVIVFVVGISFVNVCNIDVG
jgi:hypothetical protein